MNDNEIAALREDVDNLRGMMTNVVALLLQMDVAFNDEAPVGTETRKRFQESAGEWAAYIDKKILEINARIRSEMR
jgi:hypothetical protein